MFIIRTKERKCRAKLSNTEHESTNAGYSGLWAVFATVVEQRQTGWASHEGAVWFPVTTKGLSGFRNASAAFPARCAFAVH